MDCESGPCSATVNATPAEVEAGWWAEPARNEFFRKLGRIGRRWENTYVTTSNNPVPNPHLDALLAEAGWVMELIRDKEKGVEVAGTPINRLASTALPACSISLVRLKPKRHS